MSVKKLPKLNECPEGNLHVATSFVLALVVLLPEAVCKGRWQQVTGASPLATWPRDSAPSSAGPAKGGKTRGWVWTWKALLSLSLAPKLRFAAATTTDDKDKEDKDKGKDNDKDNSSYNAHEGVDCTLSLHIPKTSATVGFFGMPAKDSTWLLCSCGIASLKPK